MNEWKPEHSCPNTHRAMSNAATQYQFVVDRARRTSVAMCSWCGERWDRPDGQFEFFVWAEGYTAAMRDATDILMRAPTPEKGSWNAVAR